MFGQFCWCYLYIGDVELGGVGCGLGGLGVEVFGVWWGIWWKLGYLVVCVGFVCCWGYCFIVYLQVGMCQWI